MRDRSKDDREGVSVCVCVYVRTYVRTYVPDSENRIVPFLGGWGGLGFSGLRGLGSEGVGFGGTDPTPRVKPSL